MWTYEKAAEDCPYGFGIMRDGTTVATADKEDWARIICAACNRDTAARSAPFAVASTPEINF